MHEQDSRNSLADRLIVYTVLIGQRVELNKTPECLGVDFVCLTDQKDLVPNGWDVRKIDPMWPNDFPKSSRHPKINPHLYFSDYSRSIYIDSSVRLTVDPEKLWTKLMHSDKIVFGGVPHSFHLNMAEEITAISQLGYEANAVTNTQIEFSVANFPEYLSARPIWGGILARRHNELDCVSFMEQWFSLLAQYSRRDQLSLPLALRGLRGDQIQLSYLDNRKSEFHQWPVGGYSKGLDYTKINSDTLNLGAFSAHDIDPLPVNSLHAKSEKDSLIAERDSLIAERDAILNTKTWRWTKGARDVIFRLRLCFRDKIGIK